MSTVLSEMLQRRRALQRQAAVEQAGGVPARLNQMMEQWARSMRSRAGVVDGVLLSSGSASSQLRGVRALRCPECYELEAACAECLASVRPGVRVDPVVPAVSVEMAVMRLPFEFERQLLVAHYRDGARRAATSRRLGIKRDGYEQALARATIMVAEKLHEMGLKVRW